MPDIEILGFTGSFEIRDEKCFKPFAVRDHDESNNWGDMFFADVETAQRYATWAHDSKTGRTFRDFE